VEVLLEAGVDLLVLETFGNLDEMREAVFAAREAAGPDMTIVAQVTIDDNGNLPEGTETEVFTRRLDEWPADVIGVNCSVGPKTTLETVERMMQYTSKPISAMPNAGVPVRVEGRNLYLCSPEYMAQYARRMLWAGVRIVGGCCGTTPEHIKLIHAEARSLQPIQKKLGVTVEEPKAKAQAMPKVAVAEKAAGRKAGRRKIRGVRGDSAAARRGRFEGNRGRQAVRRPGHRLHQRAGRAAGQRAHELPGHLPAYSARRRGSRR
jgi:methionine synthase / methylenetetrahydrofolate reductase(NADPH)